MADFSPTELSRIVSGYRALEQVCKGLGVPLAEIESLLPGSPPSIDVEDMRQAVRLMISESNLEHEATEAEWPTSVYLQLRQSLPLLAASTSFREESTKPITRAEWKRIAKSQKQGSLDLFGKRNAYDDDDDEGYPFK